jgi:hypothetical protein
MKYPIAPGYLLANARAFAAETIETVKASTPVKKHEEVA